MVTQYKGHTYTIIIALYTIKLTEGHYNSISKGLKQVLIVESTILEERVLLKSLSHGFTAFVFTIVRRPPHWIALTRYSWLTTEASTSMIANTITDTSKWTNQSIPAMRVVLQAKADSCPEPKQTLVLSSNQSW